MAAKQRPVSTEVLHIIKTSKNTRYGMSRPAIYKNLGDARPGLYLSVARRAISTLLERGHIENSKNTAWFKLTTEGRELLTAKPKKTPATPKKKKKKAKSRRKTTSKKKKATKAKRASKKKTSRRTKKKTKRSPAKRKATRRTSTRKAKKRTAKRKATRRTKKTTRRRKK